MHSSTPSWPHKPDPGAGALPCQKIQTCIAMLGLLPCVGMSFSILDSMCATLFCLRAYDIWHQANPSTLLASSRERMQSFTCSTRRDDWESLSYIGLGWYLLVVRDLHSSLKLILLCLIFMYVECCSVQCLVIQSFVATLTPINHAVGWHSGTIVVVKKYHLLNISQLSKYQDWYCF